MLRQIAEMLADADQRPELERFVQSALQAAPRTPGCPECAQRKSAAVRAKNKIITAVQAVLGVGAVVLGGTGVVLLVVGQSLAAGAAGGLAGLACSGILVLHKLRPKN
ncbi:hypothetical protein [Streptomyces sp. NPDC001435]|uniref:hypothetical protein n=1 Tax=unclassified Streptomyces TaxID=2593676 RepID=UPI003675EC9D